MVVDMATSRTSSSFSGHSQRIPREDRSGKRILFTKLDPQMSSNDNFRSRIGRLGKSALIFSIIPLAFFIAVSLLTKAKGPQWLPYTFENPYSYLFNSLLLVDGRAPAAIEHPGTTTQVFGAVILRASSLKSNDHLIASVLNNPEKYIRILHSALLIFTVLTLWIAPWLTALALKDYVVGVLIQVPSLFYSILIFYGILFGPDLMVVPFSIVAVCCCALLVIPSEALTRRTILFGFSDGSSSTRLARIPLLATLAGLVCAVGVATKLTFFPLVLVSLLCCRSKKNLLAFTLAFVFGLAFALLPIYSQLSRLGTWALNLGIHSGKYDTGAVGLPQANVYLTSLLTLVQTEPLVIIIPITSTVVVVAFAFLLRKQSLTHAINWQTSLALFAIQVISLLLIAKESGTHYLIPLSLTTGLSLVLLLRAIRSASRSAFKRALGWIALVGLLGLGCKSFIEETPATYAHLREQKADQLRLYRHAQEIAKNDVRVDYFFSDSPVGALYYGNGYAGGAFGPLLSTLYPNSLFFDVFNGDFETFTGFIEPRIVLNKYDHLYFLGNTQWFPKTDALDPKTFETIDSAGNYSLQKWTRK
jgi:hypothetical protein